jgi:hypothetical protein
MTRCLCLLAALAANPASAQQVELRLGGKEVALSGEAQAQMHALAREMFSHCGPNSVQHVGNFGPAAVMTEKRLQAVAQSSRLRLRFAEPFTTVSHLGGTLGVSEAVIGLAQVGTFVGPNFSRHGDAWVEHLQCEYLPALELACLPALTGVLPGTYRDTCAKLERDQARPHRHAATGHRALLQLRRANRR